MFNARIPKIKGTKKFLGKNQPVISLGLPSLDAILGKMQEINFIRFNSDRIFYF